MAAAQLNLVLGVPMLGIVANVTLFVYLATRVHKPYEQSDKRFHEMREYMDQKFEILTGKVIDIYNRHPHRSADGVSGGFSVPDFRL